MDNDTDIKEALEHLKENFDAVGAEIIEKYGHDPTMAIPVIGAGLAMLRGHGVPALRAISGLLSLLADIDQEKELDHE